jgi:hypothetical protein
MTYELYKNSSAVISASIYKDSVLQDISSDTVTLTVKKRYMECDTDAVIIKTANVEEYGTSGVALFSLSHLDTSIPIGEYIFDITWDDGNSLYTVAVGKIKILSIVRDVIE